MILETRWMRFVEDAYDGIRIIVRGDAVDGQASALDALMDQH
jgi:hypothetical protein